MPPRPEASGRRTDGADLGPISQDTAQAGTDSSGNRRGLVPGSADQRARRRARASRQARSPQDSETKDAHGDEVGLHIAACLTSGDFVTSPNRRRRGRYFRLYASTSEEAMADRPTPRQLKQMYRRLGSVPAVAVRARRRVRDRPALATGGRGRSETQGPAESSRVQARTTPSSSLGTSEARASPRSAKRSASVRQPSGTGFARRASNSVRGEAGPTQSGPTAGRAT